MTAPARSPQATAADLLDASGLILRLAELNEEQAAQIKRLTAEVAAERTARDEERQAHEETHFRLLRVTEQRDRIKTALGAAVGALEVLGREVTAQPEQPDPTEPQSAPASPGPDSAADASASEGALMAPPHSTSSERPRMLQIVSDAMRAGDGADLSKNKLFEG